MVLYFHLSSIYILLTYFSEDTLLFWLVNFQCVTYATCVGLKKEKNKQYSLDETYIYC